MQELASVVGQIEAWIEQHAPEALENLREPASETELEKLRALLPAETPDELFQLLSVHDGEEMDSWNSILPDSMLLLPAELITQSYSYSLSRPVESIEDSLASRAAGIYRASGPVLPIAHHPKRIPFAAINYEVFWLIDLIPAAGGVVGQIILEDLEDCRWAVVAPSLSKLFSSYLSALKAGLIDVDADGCLENSQNVWARGAWVASD
jgi:cell wall assembly regulator SMI1